MYYVCQFCYVSYRSSKIGKCTNNVFLTLMYCSCDGGWIGHCIGILLAWRLRVSHTEGEAWCWWMVSLACQIQVMDVYKRRFCLWRIKVCPIWSLYGMGGFKALEQTGASLRNFIWALLKVMQKGQAIKTGMSLLLKQRSFNSRRGACNSWINVTLPQKNRGCVSNHSYSLSTFPCLNIFKVCLFHFCILQPP